MVQLVVVFCLFGVACEVLGLVRGFMVYVVLVHFGCGETVVLVLVFYFYCFGRCWVCCAGYCSTPSFVVLWFILVTVVPGFTRHFLLLVFFGVVGSCCFSVPWFFCLCWCIMILVFGLGSFF